MTQAEKLQMLETMSGETDALTLSTYLGAAGEIVKRKAFPYGDGTEDVPAKYHAVQVEIAAYKLKRRGAEGQIQHTEGSLTWIFEDGDVPPTILRRIVPKAVVP